MEDMERYGDYNEVDEAPGKGRIVTKLLKIAVLLVAATIALVLGFRIYLFNRYPDSMKYIYFTDNLLAYYNETDGNIGALKQTMRAPYDDPDRGNFFCDNLIVIRGAGELQVSLRYNTSAIENIEKDLKLEGLSADDPSLLSFRLCAYPAGSDAGYVIGELAAEPITDKLLMYRYYKLAFSGIDFGEGEDALDWITLQVFVKGQENPHKPYAEILIHENNSSAHPFEEYVLSDKEHP